MRKKGLFITFEGIEGSGKSTQIRTLAAYLRRRGIDVLVTREPGGTPAAEQIRRALLRPGARWPPVAELLLVNATRALHVEQVLRPALRRGTWVLCDRFTDATLAYQGYGRGVPLATARAINRMATGGLAPDRTLVFDLAPSRALRRARRRRRNASRFDLETDAFHQRVRAGYRTIAAREPRRVRWIEARGQREHVFRRVCTALEDLLPSLRPARARRQ
ncbi:MAG: dTMP kinase [Acidobacteriota bacterium]